MSDKAFVDTNVLMYAHDPGAGAKHRIAQALVTSLWESRNGIISTQVLQELAMNLRRKMKPALDPKVRREIVVDYIAWHVVVNGPETILDALVLEERYQISFWDALIVQAAQNGGAELVYSEDLAHGQRYGTVRVENPFR